jgi:WD40 repeat protein
VWAERQQDAFEQIVWIGFKDRIGLIDAFQNVRQAAAPDAVVPTLSLPRQIEALVSLLGTARLLLIFDNLESVMQTETAGDFRADYTALETLCNRLAEVDGTGIVAFTSREVPRIVNVLSRQTHRVAHRPLEGVKDMGARRDFLAARGIHDLQDEDVQAFGDHHDGNPKAMQLAADSIARGGSGVGGLRAYVQNGCPLPSGVTELLAAQYDRLSVLERLALAWLAVARAPRHVDDLVAAFRFRYSEAEVVAAFASLEGRSLLEPPTHDGFFLQNLLLEFVTDQVVRDLGEALDGWTGGQSGRDTLRGVPVLDPRSPRHVRDAQARTIVEPLLDVLNLRWGSRDATREHLEALLVAMTREAPREVGYGAGTIVNLLLSSGASLSGRSLCGLPLWNCDFSSADLHDVDMSGCDLRGCGFRSVLGAVTDVCFDEEALRLFATTTDGVLHAWDTSTWQQRSVRAHKGFVRALAYDPVVKRVLTVGDDRLVRSWDPIYMRRAKPLTEATQRLRCVAVDPMRGTVAWGGERGLVEVQQPGVDGVIRVTGHESTVRGLTFHRGRLISVCEGGVVLDTDVAKPALPSRSQALGEPLWCVAEFETRLVVAGQSGRPIVLNADLTPDAETLPSVRVPIWRIAAIEGRLAAVTSEGTFVLYEMTTRKIVRTIPLHGNWARALAYHATSGLVATGGEDHAIQVLRTADWSSRRSLLGASQSLWAVGAPTNDMVVAAGSDGVLHVWEARRHRAFGLGSSRSWIRALAVSPDRKTVAAAGDGGEIHLWDVTTGAVRRLGKHPGGHVWSLDFHPRQPLLASAGEDRTVRLWPTEPPAAEDEVVHEHASWVVSVRFNETGDLIASGADDGRVLVTRGRSPDPIWLVADGSRQPWALAWTGNILFAGGRDGHVRRWSPNEPEAPTAVADWGAPVWSVAVNGASLFVTGDGGAVSEFHVEDLSPSSSPRTVKSIRNHALCLSPDRRRLLIATDDGVVQEIRTDSHTTQKLIPERQYEGLRITGVSGLSDEDLASLEQLGARSDKVRSDASSTEPGDAGAPRLNRGADSEPSSDGHFAALVGIGLGLLLVVAILVTVFILQN